MTTFLLLQSDLLTTVAESPRNSRDPRTRLEAVLALFVSLQFLWRLKDRTCFAIIFSPLFFFSSGVLLSFRKRMRQQQGYQEKNHENREKTKVYEFVIKRAKTKKRRRNCRVRERDL
jgi:hypothetical protein